MRIVPPLFSIAQLLLELCLHEVCLFYAVEVRGGRRGGKLKWYHRLVLAKKDGYAMDHSPSILHLTTKVIDAIESSDQELHNGATKFDLRLNID